MECVRERERLSERQWERQRESEGERARESGRIRRGEARTRGTQTSADATAARGRGVVQAATRTGSLGSFDGPTVLEPVKAKPR